MQEPRQLAAIVSQFNEFIADEDYEVLVAALMFAVQGNLHSLLFPNVLGGRQLLSRWLQAFTHCVSVLDRRATKLVAATLVGVWLSAD